MIYIPKIDDSKVGGPITFMKNLLVYLEGVNYHVTRELKQSKGVFFPIRHSVSNLQFYKNLQLPIIQRLDGIWYESQHGSEALLKNEIVRGIYSNYATYIIFQSEYSKKQCFSQLGEISEDKYSIIINGANKSLYSPANNKMKSNKDKFHFVTTGHFRKTGMLSFIIEALQLLYAKLDFVLHVVGPLQPCCKPYVQQDFVEYHNAMTQQELSEFLPLQDIFLHSQINDNCPNAVLEAISCGIPVVGFDSGAMSELCYFNNELLAYVSDDIFQTYKQFDAGKLAEKIKLCMDNYEHFRTRALDSAHLYDFEECGAKYIKVFEKELSKAPVVSSFKREYEFHKLQVRDELARGQRFLKKIKRGVNNYFRQK